PPPPSFTKDSITPKPATPYTPPPPPVHNAPATPTPANPATAPPGKDRVRDRSTDQSPERGLEQVPDRSPEHRGADPAAKPKGNPVMTPASNLPSPPSMTREDASKSPGGVQPPNQTIAFNGQTTPLRAGAGAESGRHEVMADEKNGVTQPAGAKLII